MFEQGWIDFGQLGFGRKQKIGAIFSLVDDPTIGALAKPGLLKERVDGLDEAVEDLDPVELGELVGEFMGDLEVVDVQERVVGLDETDATFEHLPGEPFVAVDVDLASEGKQSLDANVHEPEVVVEEVEVEDALGLTAEGKARPPLAMQEFDAAAMFLAAQDGDKTVLAGFVAKEFLDEFVLVGLGLKVLIRRVGLLRQLFGMIDQTLGKGLEKRQKVHAFHLEGVIDKAIELLVAAKGEMAVENDAIMATENRYNGGRETFDKAVHGVLLPRAVW